MKKLFIIIVLMAWAMNSFAQEAHFDFSITNPTGYEFYYRIIDAQNHWVEVTYPCQNGDNYWWGYDKPEGKLILSDTIAYQGTDYYLVAIGDHAFCGCSGLRGALEFPETVQSIGAGAFKGCSNLNGNLNIPSPVTRIEDEAFCGCSGFSSKLYLTDSLTYIGSRAFQQCAFKGMLMLPSTLTFIGEEAFKGCTSFNSISIKTVTPPTTGTNAFAEVPTWISVAVPYTAKESYQNAQGWSRFASRIVEKSYWNGNAEPWTKGSGTADDPYIIESAENLAWLAKTVNDRKDVVITHAFSPGGVPYDIYRFYDVKVYQDTCFQLVIDIDLRKEENLLWYSIGNKHYINEDEYDGVVFAEHYTNNVFNQPQYYYYSYFSGQFDGDDHVVSKAHYYGSDDNMGFFGIIYNATVSNLTIDELLAHPYYAYTIGGLAARAINSTIYNCYTSGTIENSKTGGGIVGVANMCQIYNCHTSGVIKGNTGGGIVGSANRCRIEQCTTKTNFNGTYIGGIAGTFICDSTNSSQNSVLNCSFVGNINNAYKAGGIVASCQSVSEGTGTIQIENCFSRGAITKIVNSNSYSDGGDFEFGGIVGSVNHIDTLFIQNCYTNDTLTGIGVTYDNYKHYIGGILGRANASTTLYIKNCYHAGAITSKTYKGGILAQNTNMTIVRNCFFDQSTAPDDGFGLPLESDYMKTEAFVNRLNNGSSVFRMDVEPFENDGYPVFGTDGLIFVGAEWYYEIHGEDGTITYQHLKCVGDTTINTERPKIIIRSNTQYDRDSHTEVTREYVYEKNGVVYWWNNTLGKFTVLYDFSAEVGDEWTIEVGNETITTRVYESELQYIEGIPYKRLTIADPNDDFSGTVLSSIGHQTSFFPERLMSRGKGFSVDGLRCYWVDDELVYKQGDEDCDAIYAELHNDIEETLDDAMFTVYPNPANHNLFVQTLRATSLPAGTYCITNLMGQTVLSGNITSETQQINIEKLPAGMYFISVGKQTVKFVVK